MAPRRAGRPESQNDTMAGFDEPVMGAGDLLDTVYVRDFPQIFS
jgi:hypothetical protein